MSQSVKGVVPQREKTAAMTVAAYRGLSETDLRAKHDNVFKIRAGVKRLKQGFYLTDQQMREMCKVATNVWRGYAENAEFDSYKIKLGDTVYWGVPRYIKRLREDMNVS